MENEKEKEKGEEQQKKNNKNKNNNNNSNNNMDEVHKGIPPKIYAVPIATESDRCDPADWPHLLHHRTTDLLILKKGLYKY